MTSKKPAKKRKATKKVVKPSIVEPVSGYVEPVIPNPEIIAEFDPAGPVTIPSPEPSNLQKTRWQQWCEWWDK
jgi:hypothetical protein